MNCPKCKSEQIEVRDSRSYENCVKRRRLCFDCGFRFSTVEISVNEYATQKWIPVTERLPKNDSDVLAYLRIGEIGRIYPANYANGMWFDCTFNTPATDTTTHWMPLPEPPKED